MRRSFFLTFEGLDGSGKTTHLRLLAEALERQGLPVLVTHQPGDTTLGERIRALLLDAKTTDIAPMTEMALMFADRTQSIQQIISPALEAGKIVICDRFTDSTEAYQGGGRKLGSDAVLALHRVLCRNLQPDLTILLLPPLEISLARTCSRSSNSQTGGDADRFEREKRAFHERVFARYREIAARETTRVVAIEGDLPVEAIQERILRVVQERLVAFRLYIPPNISSPA